MSQMNPNRRRFLAGSAGDEADELVTIKSIRIDQDTTAINNRSVLLVAEKNFVASQVTIWATSLHFPNFAGVQLELAVNTLDKFTD